MTYTCVGVGGWGGGAGRGGWGLKEKGFVPACPRLDMISCFWPPSRDMAIQGADGCTYGYARVGMHASTCVARAPHRRARH